MNRFAFTALAAVSAFAFATPALAQAVITNGTVGLGVDTGGQLNIDSDVVSTGGTSVYGLRDIATGYEATAQGCPCEGWGAAIAGTGTTVYANNAAGSSFTPVSFTSAPNSATSIVNSVDGALQVTHAFAPSSSLYLYQATVTITNTSGADFMGATLYRRVMDWDIEPTPFNEYSTIQGVTGATNVLFSSNNGFASSNPFDSAGGTPGPFTDLGPTDHGALFDFTFDPLAAGASRTLKIFYGAAPTESLALAALSSVGAEVYSFGQSADNIDGDAAGRATFIFGFQGVGGTVLPGVPEPATWALMIMGFGAVGGSLRSRRRTTRVAFAA